ncbi:MAG: hypothetical protein U0637_03345 [Phycisphaerales bacterium]
MSMHTHTRAVTCALVGTCAAALAHAQGCYVPLTMPANTPTFEYQSQQAWDVSADGGVVVGQINYINPQTTLGGNRQVIWNANNTITFLDQTLPPSYIVRGVSGNGQWIVGEDQTLIRAFRWRIGSSGPESLYIVPGADTSESTDVSFDGNTVVGISGNRPFRWTPQTGIVSLGTLPGATICISAECSADGNVVVGTFYTPVPFTYIHFVWTAATGIQAVPTLTGTQSRITRVSSDGVYVLTGDGYPLPGGLWNRTTGTLTPIVQGISNYWEANDLEPNAGALAIAGRRLAGGTSIIVSHPTTGVVDAFQRAGVAPVAIASVPVVMSNDARTILATAANQRVFKICLPPWTAGNTCDSIDFNRDGLFPDGADISAFLRVFSGSACPTSTCGDLDFNNDGVSPDTTDIDALLRVFSGGPC